MNFTQHMQRTAIVIASAVSFFGASAAQAATFADNVKLTLTVNVDAFATAASSTIASRSLLGSATSSNLSAASPTIVVYDQLTTLSSPAATDLVTTGEAGAGLSFTSGGGRTFSFSDFVYSNATKSATALIKVNNSVVSFTGPALTTTTATVVETFVEGVPFGQGLINTGDLKLTDPAINALLNAIGVAPFLQATARSNLQSLAFGRLSVEAVPEPSTYALMGLGLVGVVLVARKRKAA